MRLWNTLSGALEEFVPLEPGRASVYTCGPTVYDRVHIGNLRAFVFYDLLVRSLRWSGLEVVHVMNVTDVDDKTIRGARAAGRPLREFTDAHLGAFLGDLDALGVVRPTAMPRATDPDAIGDMVDLVERLVAKGFAYKAADGSVYFRIAAFQGYGRLGHLDVRGLEAGAGGRVAADEYEKDDPRDFALWKAWAPEDGDVAWDTRVGRGRPGWHLECSALAMRHLGETIDIHAGGVDLIFPHHENEIAQSEAATGRPFCGTWLHNEHLLVGGQKMAKRLRNFYTLGDLERMAGARPREVRFALLKVHYRQPLNFQVTRGEGGEAARFDAVDEARASLERIDAFRRSLADRPGGGAPAAAELALDEARRDFAAAIEDDLNAPRAIAAVFGLVGALNRESFGAGFAARVEAALADFDRVLGFLAPPAATLSDDERRLLGARAAERAAAAALRAAGDTAGMRSAFARSDELREELRRRGVLVEDRPDGSAAWRRR